MVPLNLFPYVLTFVFVDVVLIMGAIWSSSFRDGGELWWSFERRRGANLWAILLKQSTSERCATISKR